MSHNPKNTTYYIYIYLKLKLLSKGQDSMPEKSRLLFVSIKLSPRVSGFSVDYCLFAGFLDKMQISVQQPHPISLIYLHMLRLAPGGSNLSSAISHKPFSEQITLAQYVA